MQIMLKSMDFSESWKSEIDKKHWFLHICKTKKSVKHDDISTLWFWENGTIWYNAICQKLTHQSQSWQQPFFPPMHSEIVVASHLVPTNKNAKSWKSKILLFFEWFSIVPMVPMVPIVPTAKMQNLENQCCLLFFWWFFIVSIVPTTKMQNLENQCCLLFFDDFS